MDLLGAIVPCEPAIVVSLVFLSGLFYYKRVEESVKQNENGERYKKKFERNTSGRITCVCDRLIISLSRRNTKYEA